MNFEYYIDLILLRSLPRGKVLIKEEWEFSQKLIILDSQGTVSPEMVGVLRALNKLRNKCAHRLDYEPTLEEMSQIAQPLGSKAYSQLKKENDMATGGVFLEAVSFVLGNLLGTLRFKT